MTKDQQFPPGMRGRAAVVTGGTSGVGLAVARRLCAAGAHVLLNYAHDDEAAGRAVRELDALPGTAETVKGDIADSRALDALLSEADRRFGGLDVFVHNTAYFRPSPTLGTEPADVDRSLAVALTPLLRGGQRLAELMAGRSGRIIAVSSLGAGRVVPRYVSAGVAKAALEALVRYLAVELAEGGITVNAVSTAKIDKSSGETPPEVRKKLATRTPGGRLTTPDDIAGVVALLCSEEAAWIQGQVIVADGGFSLSAV
ncbi:SDR family oxidoreductase [Streptomyces bacillaris]|uniref:SDR family oxidoreductase n=1 Tax=Streptomyces bacillaris TaxID=68179 RepID=UPI003360B877